VEKTNPATKSIQFLLEKPAINVGRTVQEARAMGVAIANYSSGDVNNWSLVTLC